MRLGGLGTGPPRVWTHSGLCDYFPAWWPSNTRDLPAYFRSQSTERCSLFRHLRRSTASLVLPLQFIPPALDEGWSLTNDCESSFGLHCRMSSEHKELPNANIGEPFCSFHAFPSFFLLIHRCWLLTTDYTTFILLTSLPTLPSPLFSGA